MLMMPELVVIATAFAVLLFDMFSSEEQRRMLIPLALVGLGAAMVSLVVMPMYEGMLGGRFAMDAVAWWFKLVFLLCGIVTVIFSRDMLDGLATVRTRGVGFRGEFLTILLFTISGMMYLISARDIITLYVSLELATIPLFILTAWRRDDPQSGEAGLKYVILGALASAFILYGLGLLYGLTGTTNLTAIGQALRKSEEIQPAFWLASAMMLAGIGFKLTVVPFHLWAADVYQGAPVPVTAYLSVASKGAGLAFLFQVFYRVLDQVPLDWDLLIALFAAVTMTLGNTVAIVQTNIKRFMAFSAISQAGYFLLGLLGHADQGVPAMVFYMLVYVVSNLAVFGCIVWYSNETGREEIVEYRGLSLTNPLMALMMMVALFSLAGIPPLSGFVGKFFLFSIAAKAGFHWLVAVAAVNSTISLYYYLRVVRQMYIEPPVEGEKPHRTSGLMAGTIAVLTAGVALLGIVPTFYETVYNDTVSWLSLLGL